MELFVFDACYIVHVHVYYSAVVPV